MRASANEELLMDINVRLRASEEEDEARHYD
jgi:hypothetical protein